MENKFLLTDDLLWDYADDFLAGPEKAQVETYLDNYPEAQERLQLILDEKQALASLKLESPGAGFADRVLAAWAAEQVHRKAAGGKDWIIRLIALGFALFVLTPVVVMVVAAFQMGPIELPEVPLPELPTVDWEGILNSPVLFYGLLLLATVSALRLLDKVLQHQRIAHKLT